MCALFILGGALLILGNGSRCWPPSSYYPETGYFHMIQIPFNIIDQFTAFVGQKGVPQEHHHYYVKWLRYYLDFCHRYSFKQYEQTSIPAFLEKLKEKGQVENLRKQAQHAVTLFLAMQTAWKMFLPGRITFWTQTAVNKLQDPLRPVTKTIHQVNKF